MGSTNARVSSRVCPGYDRTTRYREPAVRFLRLGWLLFVGEVLVAEIRVVVVDLQRFKSLLVICTDDQQQLQGKSSTYDVRSRFDVYRCEEGDLLELV